MKRKTKLKIPKFSTLIFNKFILVNQIVNLRNNICIFIDPGLLSGYSDGLLVGRLGFDSRHEIFLYSTASRPALGPTQPLIQWALGALPAEVKRQGHVADHSPPSNAEVKNGGAIPPLPYMFSWRGA
jgi:hypothetical protein